MDVSYLPKQTIKKLMMCPKKNRELIYYLHVTQNLQVAKGDSKILFSWDMVRLFWHLTPQSEIL